jgi:hypothetical protein
MDHQRSVWQPDVCATYQPCLQNGIIFVQLCIDYMRFFSVRNADAPNFETLLKREDPLGTRVFSVHKLQSSISTARRGPFGVVRLVCC